MKAKLFMLVLCGICFSVAASSGTCNVEEGSCSGEASIQSNQQINVAKGESYTNPILTRDFPDPTVIKGGDGLYYAYATESAGNKISVAKSENLVHWTSASDAFPDGNSWATVHFWAPDVSFRDGTQTSDKNMCIGVATSQNPLGPFKDLCGKGNKALDPHMFDAPDGKIFLYWGSDYDPIWVRELDSTRLKWASGSEQKAILHPSSAPYEKLVEGPWVTYDQQKSKYFFMYYSGDNCCYFPGTTPHYAVMVARSLSPTGPFEKMNYPLLESGGEFFAPGHNSVLRDEGGEDWIFYHTYVKPETKQRDLMIDHITYLNDWPTISGEEGKSATPSKSGTGPAYNKR